MTQFDFKTSIHELLNLQLSLEKKNIISNKTAAWIEWQQQKTDDRQRMRERESKQTTIANYLTTTPQNINNIHKRVNDPSLDSILDSK